ncbi:hypothetical protein BDY19DRAFT_947987 [Irpex rosettiformis]|uniref:Uncharacterized protein n=1 Tax=Irpex rosettiformis TaxID=378272 RepID=A0ACB8U2Q1_9APHY|nr:hypothetical protein BDY19DRAFT_947987 [Irpex rosettiformis]
MSRANSNNVLPALARRNHTHHDHYNTPQFCDLLESAVEYMQTKHLENPRGHPFSELPDDFLEQLRDAIHAGRYYMLALGVVLIYEFIITIDLEVELVWRRLRRCIVIFLFFLNRYLALATYIFVISGVQYANTDSGFCTGIFSRFPSVFIVLAEAMTGSDCTSHQDRDALEGRPQGENIWRCNLCRFPCAAIHSNSMCFGVAGHRTALWKTSHTVRMFPRLSERIVRVITY